MPYIHHIFVCENKRSPDDPRGSCGQKNSADIRVAMKKEISLCGLKGSIRANNAGCLDQCEKGPTVVVYPEGIWYGGVSVDDVHEIVHSHIIEDKPVERLLINTD
jgi:(2Fe-2S) ferredoxin